MKQQESFNAHTNANESNSQSSELVTREDVTGSPFKIIGTEHGYFLALGKYRLTENCETKEEITELLTEEMYNIILKVLAILIPAEITIQLHQQNQTT